MESPIEPRYLFFFERPDGGRYSREVYQEALYVFPHRGEQVLVAARVVPHSSGHYALYEAMKGKGGAQVLQKLLPAASPDAAENPDAGESAALVRAISGILPDVSSGLPESVLDASVREVEAAASQVLARAGIEGGLDAFSAPGFEPASEGWFADPADMLHVIAGSGGEDAGWVNLSFHVDAAVKQEMRERMEARVEDGALARPEDMEFDIFRKLYSNPKYLAFVRRVLDAHGSYISPVVRDFLSFYARCLNTKLHAFAEEEHVDPEILRKRLEGVLGRERGDSSFFLDYYELTILGTVQEGALPLDREDPDRAGESFKVDPRLDVGTLVVREIRDAVHRFRVRKFVEHTFNRHHNIKAIRFVDAEGQSPQAGAGSRLDRWVDERTWTLRSWLFSFTPLKEEHLKSEHLFSVLLGVFIGVALVGAAIVLEFVWKVGFGR